MNTLKLVLKNERFIKHSLLFVFIMSVALRVILGVAFGQMNVFYDELLHWNLSKSVFYHMGSLFRNDMLSYKEILYSVVLSVSHYFGNTEMQYFVAVGINSVLMSSVVFPVYAMSKKFLGNNFYALILSLVSILLPEMAYTAKIIQENLFYPLAIWFFFLFIVIILENQYKRRNMVLLGIYVFIISLCKQMALNIAAGLILYYVLQFFFFDKVNRKKCFFCLLWFMAVFFGLKFAYGIWFDYAYGLKDVSASEATIGVILMNLLDPYLLSQLIYPAVTYLLLSILYMGVFPVLLPLALFKELKEKERNLLILIGAIFLSTVMVICLRIIPTENLDQLTIRFHFRYLFYLTVPILILLFSIKDRIAMETWKIRTVAILALIYILLLNYIKLLPEDGSKIDCVGANYIKYLFASDMMQSTLYILIFAAICFGFYLLYQKKAKLLISLILIGFLISGVVSNCYTYNEFYKNKKMSVYKKEDAFTLNAFFENTQIKDRSSSLLIISETKYSDAKLEVYLEHPNYYFCKMEDFKNFTENYSENYSENNTLNNTLNSSLEPFSELDLYSFNISFRDEDFTYPDYIVSYEAIHIDGYEEMNLPLNKYYMYSRVE